MRNVTPTQGSVLLLGIDRSANAFAAGGNGKVLTQLRDLDQLNGLNLIAVLCHVERTRVRGHWVAFVKTLITGQAAWWKLDE